MGERDEITLGYDAAWFADVLDAMSEFVLVKGPASRLLWANKAFREYYGLSNAQLAGLVDAPDVPADMTLKYVRDDHEVFTSQKPLVVDEPVARHDGMVAHYRTIKTPIVIDDRTDRTVGTSRPIADAPSVEDSARKSQERSEGLATTAVVLNTLPTTAALVDAHGTIVGTTRAFCTAFALADVVGCDFAETLQDRLPISDAFETVLTHGEEVDRELRTDGAIYEVNLRPWQPREGETTGVFVVCKDITELHRARQAAVERARELEELLKTLGTAVIGVDEDGKFLVFNEEAQRITLGKLGSGDPNSWAEKFGIHNADGTPTETEDVPLVRALAGLTTRDRLMILREEDDHVDDKWISVSAAPLVAGRFRAVASFSDVSTLIQTQRELEQFAFVASHDLQEPLRMMRSYVGLLSEELDTSSNESFADYMHFINDSAARMSSLVRDLLDFSRVGSTHLEIADISVADLLDEVEGDLALAITESGAEIIRDVSSALVGDRSQLRQLLTNLVKNAIKFRSPDRPIVVTVRAREESTGWRVEVDDNGIGFDPRFRDRVFRMFQRLHRREDYPGTGIGLAICKRVVERHGGVIGVETVQGRGTTFWFTLPRVSKSHEVPEDRQENGG